MLRSVSYLLLFTCNHTCSHRTIITIVITITTIITPRPPTLSFTCYSLLLRTVIHTHSTHQNQPLLGEDGGEDDGEHHLGEGGGESEEQAELSMPSWDPFREGNVFLYACPQARTLTHTYTCTLTRTHIHTYTHTHTHAHAPTTHISAQVCTTLILTVFPLLWLKQFKILC